MSKQFNKLEEIIAKLRDPETGCPWDKEQTHETLKPYVIEEAYEVVEAIDDTPNALKKELGDLLLQVMLHSQIAKDNGTFTVTDVVNALSEKLIHRHPHVFGETKADTSKQVLENWEKLKAKEKDAAKGTLDGVPKAMPALLRAQRISEKAARVGFEWKEFREIKDKVLEEVLEFTKACSDGDNSNEIQKEYGDILFALVQVARRMGFDAEQALQQSTNKFINRFQKIEQRSTKPVSESTLEELDKLWNEVKKEES